MAIHMGIMCEACGLVHFVASSPGITLSRNIEGIYRLACKAPCSEVKMFRKEAMHPYRVSEDVFKKGYAEAGEYEVLQK
jgi:hypothetical protein